MGRNEFCEFVYACDSFMHQKCFNYALTNLSIDLVCYNFNDSLEQTSPNFHDVDQFELGISFPSFLHPIWFFLYH